MKTELDRLVHEAFDLPTEVFLREATTENLTGSQYFKALRVIGQYLNHFSSIDTKRKALEGNVSVNPHLGATIYFDWYGEARAMHALKPQAPTPFVQLVSFTSLDDAAQELVGLTVSKGRLHALAVDDRKRRGPIYSVYVGAIEYLLFIPDTTWIESKSLPALLLI